MLFAPKLLWLLRAHLVRGWHGRLRWRAINRRHYGFRRHFNHGRFFEHRFYHAYATLSDGTIQCWGYNYIGELGNGTRLNSSVPVNASGVTGTISVVAGEGIPIAIVLPTHATESRPVDI